MLGGMAVGAQRDVHTGGGQVHPISSRGHVLVLMGKPCSTAFSQCCIAGHAVDGHPREHAVVGQTHPVQVELAEALDVHVIVVVATAAVGPEARTILVGGVRSWHHQPARDRGRGGARADVVANAACARHWLDARHEINDLTDASGVVDRDVGLRGRVAGASQREHSQAQVGQAKTGSAGAMGIHAASVAHGDRSITSDVAGTERSRRSRSWPTQSTAWGPSPAPMRRPRHPRGSAGADLLGASPLQTGWCP